MTRKGLGSDVLWSGTELVLRYGVQFASLIVLSRFITPAGFGLMAMAMIVIALGNVVSDSGMTTALTRLPQAEPAHFATAQRFGLLAGSTCVALAALLAWPLGRLFGQAEVGPLLVVASLALPLIGMSVASDASLIRAGRFADRAKAQLAASMTGAIVAVALAISGAGPWALVAQLVATSAARTLILGRMAKIRGTPSMAMLRVLLPFSSFLLAAGLLDAIANRLQAALLGKLFGPVELGYYGQAQTIQQVPTTAFSAMVNKVALPRFSEALASGRLREMAAVTLRGTWLVFFPAMCLAAICAAPLVPKVLGTPWAPMVPVLAALCASAALWPIHVINLLVCTARGDGRAFFRLEVIKKIILIATVAAFGWRGPLPMAYAVGLASLAGGIVNASYSATAIGYGVATQARDVAPGALASLLASAAALIAGRFATHDGWMQALTMAASFSIIYALPGLLLGMRTIRAWRHLAASVSPTGETTTPFGCPPA